MENRKEFLTQMRIGSGETLLDAELNIEWKDLVHFLGNADWMGIVGGVQ